jgi:predicted RNA binding protein YcfA (HicA-like mRNA interferase family)
MKGRQLIRRLRAAGVEIEERRDKGGHYYARCCGQQTAIPIHGDTDLGPAFIRRICKQLDLDPNRVL